MQTYYLIIVFIYGLLLGSFYNVVGYRIPNNISILKPRSFCPKCNHKLKWYELLPVISFIIQRGKCNKCKCSISIFYPIIELLTGVLFAISYYLFGFGLEFIVSILTVSFLVIVIVSDFNYLIIPDEVTLTFSLLSIIIQLIFGGLELAVTSLIYGLFLFGLMLIIMLLGNKIFKEESLGGGDVKLMFFVGTVLNVITPMSLDNLVSLNYLLNGFFEIFLSSLLASPFAIVSYFSKKGRIIPFGPFILMALLVMYLSQLDVLELFKVL